MGDRIDPHTGSLTFEHLDVAVPGNSTLDVSVRRRRSQGFLYSENVQAEFGDWELLAPRIKVVSGPTLWNGARCTALSTLFPVYNVPGPTTYGPSDYSTGVILDVPGRGSQQVLWDVQGGQWPSGTAHVTTENWRLTCGVAASDGGEGIYATAPNGDRYRFDRYITHSYKHLGTIGGSGYLDRTQNILAATEVTDVSGNWVRYGYDASGRLTSIISNDGRTITLSYQGSSKLIYQVTANGRTWTYSYAPSNYAVIGTIDNTFPSQDAVLRSVTLPDGTAWTFSLDGLTAEAGPGTNCRNGGGPLSLTHPNGAQGHFTVAEQYHRQSFDQNAPFGEFCPFDDETQGGINVPMVATAYFDGMTTTAKSITAPGAPSATWTFDYENDKGAVGTGDHMNWTKVQEPDGRHLTYYHYFNGEFGVDITNVNLPPLPQLLPSGIPFPRWSAIPIKCKKFLTIRISAQ